MVRFFRQVDKAEENESKPLLKGKQSTCYGKAKSTFLILFVLAHVVLLGYLVNHWLKSSTTNNNVSETLVPVSRLNSQATTNGDYFKQCAPKVTCDPNAKYRTFNGSCNNLARPNWGAALTPFYRLGNAVFSDGKYEFRLQADGKPLPSARSVGVKLFYAREVPYFDGENNQLLVPWGQFITHDMSFYPDDIRGKSTPIHLDQCFNEDKSKIPPECAYIVKISKDDPTYGKYNVSLFKFVRSLTSANFSCPLVPTTILNKNTHYIDASHIYGSDQLKVNELREFQNGKLRSRIIDGEEYCPQDENSPFAKGPIAVSNVQFLAGDVNANQNVAISLFQNLFLRFHNYVANELQTVNPLWSDETIYQETRRILGAIIQIITYRDYLPILLGDFYMEYFGLNNKTVYDPTLNPAMSQEMTSGAFRAVHNIIPAKFNFISKNYSIIREIEPSTIMQAPDILLGNFDYILRGFMESPGRAPQPSYNNLITNIVFQIPNKNKNSGFDLMSYDIQRGRDNGLPPYNKMRKLCGLEVANTFEDLSDLISKKDIDTLKELYTSVDDIDYLIGALLEKPQNKSMVGPSVACVIADNFYRLKFGDRFFYDVEGHPGSFTKEQIKALEQITFSHIICKTSLLDHLQKETFRFVDSKWLSSIKYSCDLYQFDFSPWKE
ncbi:peroxidase-like [Adelges cooleyi]|uniref:peroxidase-like n=1 Tax=Adelges cooleyi TaxID=133065 RepID=UPI00217F6F8F|nr:peroxidase-like [Adelges cooleyi]